ncbi:DUF4450 domain-containing protein [Segetibacter sp. 3557_3]|nr:DUF4450 domain-containing protein [Segetibacter sp. 3557_3]
MTIRSLMILTLLGLLLPAVSSGQVSDSTRNWHGKARSIHYTPQGEDFICVNGRQRFNRALYGTNTGFRVEAGDLPEFALYMPGMGGNFKLGIAVGQNSKWLTAAQQVKATYRTGSMIYDIADPMLGTGTIRVTVLALAGKEGMIIKTEIAQPVDSLRLIWAYGGASGKKFSRDGDIGADPESVFYMQPAYCRDNIYRVDKNVFRLQYGTGTILSEAERYEVQHRPDSAIKGEKVAGKQLLGTVPTGSDIRLAEANLAASPTELLQSRAGSAPIICGSYLVRGSDTYYYCIENPSASQIVDYKKLPLYFIEAESAAKALASRIKVNTPDPFINTIGGALSMAADAIWEDPSFLHGAVAWRMRLNAWRGAYVADPLGWHDRARKHFSSYALSQVTTPETGPVVSDTALHLARQLEKLGTSLFSSGYISRNPGGDFRAHHYDMNLVFIDQLLNHIQYTGDTAFARKMFPLLQRHLKWEKRNFDVDGDGLYDAYAAIWASDALQYSGGGVTHSSAYNYRANKTVAGLATMLGEDPTPYQAEADHILKALNTNLWLPAKGVYAEYKDLLGLKRVHTNPGIWTIYHAIDSKITDPFQAYRSLRYIDTHIPHIPVRARGLADTSLYLLSTSNWQPYTWSINNVALAEVLHTSLAYWQGGRKEEAYRLWKSAIVESMYLSSSPGGFQQLSFYDAIRGELYRDFADPVGMAGRTLVEGLFGIFPDALKDTLHITPGFPQAWDHASLSTPDIRYAFKRTGEQDHYSIKREGKTLALLLKLPARLDSISSLTVNGKPADWDAVADAIGTPCMAIRAAAANEYEVQVSWAGKPFERPAIPAQLTPAANLVVSTKLAKFAAIYDPGKLLIDVKHTALKLSATTARETADNTAFAKVRQGQFTWWIPLNVNIADRFQLVDAATPAHPYRVTIRNLGASTLSGRLITKGKTPYNHAISISAHGNTMVDLPLKHLMPGTNQLFFQSGQNTDTLTYTNWNIKLPEVKTERLDMDDWFNDAVTSIFKNEYLSPRPAVPTLQLPIQGIGNWCYPLVTAHINDSGLRQRAGSKGEIVLSQGIPLATPAEYGSRNIAFTSLWDNYPDTLSIPLSGKARHVYLLMAGSTNPMQSRFDNGQVLIKYTDGTSAKLLLKNPENWWPIQEDYLNDRYAFTTDAPVPVRVHLQSGIDTREFKNYTSIKGFSNRVIDGGAATVLDLPLDPSKTLASLVLQTLANDVVIGLMSVTLVRE